MTQTQLTASQSSHLPDPIAFDNPWRCIHVAREGDVEWLSLSRPDNFNALNLDLTQELYDYFGSLPDRQDVRVVVLRGAGRHFCAGYDLEDVNQLTVSLDQGLRLQRQLSSVVLRMRRCPQPIIGLLQGAACGGGFALALGCDVRFAAPNARMNVAMAKIGLTGCDMGISYFLPRAVGPAIAAELMYTGRFVNAERALRIGLVNNVMPEDKLAETAQELVQEMLAMSPVGLRLTKDGLAMAQETSNLATVMALEDRGQAMCFDAFMKEGVAAFREKRAPNYESSQ
ncbi:MAG: enoyl-CoA hydratase/isomerase family protein [Rhodoferax sp.]|uniref:enoyl-CoA hydratase/isomerase family protein n=1 Tax=Rhodoferax sp. TaxID=50421 RepID=UPI00260D51D4|nr:enoyl-CoA hydratase/isomerase family protein [Rhodoferax sp.]MDD2879827.1 enoyl-CoA hydratase/isomerase family protein [Rhodoferax sp.]